MRIPPPPSTRSMPVSVRFPSDLLDELTAYAKRIGTDRSYVIVECVKTVLSSDRDWQKERRPTKVRTRR
jgi:metal-responsive CopG/Arc/MetJ family transcriptional regulator